MEIQKAPNKQNNLEKEQRWRHHTPLISDNTTKPQQSKQYGTHIKKDSRINRTEEKAQK